MSGNLNGLHLDWLFGFERARTRWAAAQLVVLDELWVLYREPQHEVRCDVFGKSAVEWLLDHIVIKFTNLPVRGLQRLPQIRL